jgi:hypothetical protein
MARVHGERGIRMTKAERVGLMTLFNALIAGVHNAFWLDINGRLFFKKAPSGISLADGPYAIFFSISDVNDDTFTEEIRDDYIQFSLFSGESSDDKILDMDEHLTALLNGKSYTITGAQVTILRQQGNGPNAVSETTEMGTEEYSQTDIDYKFSIQPTL